MHQGFPNGSNVVQKIPDDPGVAKGWGGGDRACYIKENVEKSINEARKTLGQ